MDLWSRRTLEVLKICGAAMHSMPLAKQFQSAVEYCKQKPCELRIHDVRSSLAKLAQTDMLSL